MCSAVVESDEWTWFYIIMNALFKWQKEKEIQTANSEWVGSFVPFDWQNLIRQACLTSSSLVEKTGASLATEIVFNSTIRRGWPIDTNYVTLNSNYYYFWINQNSNTYALSVNHHHKKVLTVNFDSIMQKILFLQSLRK